MLQDQFFHCLVFILIFGIVFIYTMIKMASCNSVETTSQKHVVLKVIGSIEIILATSYLVEAIKWFFQVEFPEQLIDVTYNVNQIYLHYGQTIVWGYPTAEQNHVIKSATNLYSSLAFAAYCIFYKKSDRRWWKKILRFIYVLLMFAFYISATNFHYFDASEFVAPGLFCLMAAFSCIRANKLDKQKAQLAQQQRNEAIHQMMDERLGTESITEVERQAKIEDDVRFMPNCEEIETARGNNEKQIPAISEQANLSQNEQAKDEEVSGGKEEVVKYCRHCGRKVDYDSSIYCKYCGKEL